jgi:Ca2+-binding RTX toxin-like protein
MANITGTDGNDTLTGTAGDDTILGLGGNDLIIASGGNDTIEGRGGYDTLDYSKIGRPVKILASWFFEQVRPGTLLNSDLRADKSGFGKDIFGTSILTSIPESVTKDAGFEKIIGATNQKNTFDASAGNNVASLDLNLANHSLKVNIPNAKTQQFELVNFVNVIGTRNNDTIVGANKNSKLTGGGGNDLVTGGSKNDIITGSDSTARGVGEVDTLTGGGGRDKFVLGDKNGAYYVGKGEDDYALITDFNLFQDSISIGNLKNYSFVASGNNSIDLYSGKDVNTRDLIAKIQMSGGISSASSNLRSISGSSPNLDSIISKIDVVFGTSLDLDA